MENPFRAERVAARIAASRVREQTERRRRDREEAEGFVRELRAGGRRNLARWADRSYRIDSRSCGDVLDEREQRSFPVVALVTVSSNGRYKRLEVDPRYAGTGIHKRIAGHAMTMRFAPGDERTMPIRFELVRDLEPAALPPSNQATARASIAAPPGPPPTY